MTSDDADALVSDHLDGVLDAPGVERLDAWLAEDAEHRRRYVRMVMDHRALLGRRAPPFAQPARARPSGRRRPAMPRQLRAAAVLAACLSVGVAGWWLSRQPGQRPILATVSAASQAIIDQGQDRHPLHAGEALMPGNRVLVERDGQLAFTYPEGTAMRLVGESQAVLADDQAGKRIRLELGRLEAVVSPQPAGHPAIIATADGITTVLGTILAVTRVAGETRTEVTRGQVSLARTDDARAVRIAAGEYAIAAPGEPLIAHAIGSASGATYAVGAGQPYATLDALPPLRPGDIVELRPGTYGGAHRWTASGTALRPITIRGAAQHGSTIIDGTGLALGIGAMPHALFDILGAHYRIENLEFAHARNGGTATGIICSGGAAHTILKACRILQCDKGIDATDDDLSIDGCEVGWCGDAGNDGFCHGLLLSGAACVIRHCDIHDLTHGQGIKSRCLHLEIRACRIADAEDGEIGIVEPPPGTGTGGDVILAGNLVVSKAGRHGNQSRFIETGSGPGPRRSGTLVLIGNTLVAGDPRIVFISTANSAMRTLADGNIFVGSDRIAALGEGALSGRWNWAPPTATLPTGLLDGVAPHTPVPGFADLAGRDFHLRADSPCRAAWVSDDRFLNEASGEPGVVSASAPASASAATVPTLGRRSDVGAYGVRP